MTINNLIDQLKLLPPHYATTSKDLYIELGVEFLEEKIKELGIFGGGNC